MPRVVIESVRGEGYCVVCRRRIMGRHIMSTLFEGQKFQGDLRVCEDCQRRMHIANEGIPQEVELLDMVDPDNPPAREPIRQPKPGQQPLLVRL